MTTQWIILHIAELVRAHHTHAAIAYLHRFDRGAFRHVMAEIRAHQLRAALRELAQLLKQLEEAMS